jgi:tRNA dimethylallyltransferase
LKSLLVVIGGPTGIGKTATAINLAQEFRTEIISADSRQLFRELTIGTAVPSIEELKTVKHHFIHSHSIENPYNASIYENEVLIKLNELFARYEVVIMVGGSGLYIDAVCNGIDDLPTVPVDIREKYISIYNTFGLDKLREMVKLQDPDYYNIVDLSNPKRLLKALEVYEITGKAYSSLLQNRRKDRPFRIVRITLDVDRTILYHRINQRTDMMINSGLEKEALSMLPKKQLTPLNTVGYKEFFNYFEGKITREQAIEQIKNHTRAYARRQLTWFRKHKDSFWFTPEQTEAMKVLIKNELSKSE